LEFADVESTDPTLGYLVVADVAVIATDPLVSTRAKCLGTGAGQDDRADLEIIASPGECVAQLGEGLWAKRVSHLRSVNRDLCDAVGRLVEDVGVSSDISPLDRGVEISLGRGVFVTFWQSFLRDSRVGCRARRRGPLRMVGNDSQQYLASADR
jgi:hypothetical protein